MRGTERRGCAVGTTLFPSRSSPDGPASRRRRGERVTKAFCGPSSGGATAFVVYPLADEIRAGDNTEVAIFAVHKV